MIVARLHTPERAVCVFHVEAEDDQDDLKDTVMGQMSVTFKEACNPIPSRRHGSLSVQFRDWKRSAMAKFCSADSRRLNKIEEGQGKEALRRRLLRRSVSVIFLKA